MMFVNGRGDYWLAVQIADDATRNHIGIAVRVEVVECVDRIADAKDGDLPTVEQRGHAAVRDQLIE
jgi:hypothetical protein